MKNQLRAKYAEKNKEVKRCIKSDKKKWLNNIASQAEEAARSQHMKTLYVLTKTLNNGSQSQSRQSTSVMDKHGNLLGNKKDIQDRWTEHFKEVLSKEPPQNPITIMDDDEEKLDFQEAIEEIVDTEPTLGEVKEAVRKLKNGKAPGIDNITAELPKTDIEFSTIKIHELLSKIWKFEVIPEAWKKGLIIKLPKKGNLKDCKNSRGITLLSIVGKILGSIVIDRVRSGADKRLRKEQAGYRQGRGTTEQVFILRNIIEQVNEWQVTIYVNFIDFEKVFDLVHRDSLWVIMRKYGIPEKIIRIIQLFYVDFQCAVEDQGERGEWFNIKTGVKQGCNMSGFLFISLIRMRSKRDIKMGRLCTPGGAVLGIVGGGVTFRFLNGEAILDENMLFWVRLYALVVVLKILLDFRL